MSIAPKEILISQTLAEKLGKTLPLWKQLFSRQPDSRFDAKNAEKKLLETFHVSTLDGFGKFSEAETIAGGSILDYISLTQKGKIPTISFPKHLLTEDHLQIDAATRQSLEIHQTLKGEYKGCLLHTIDRTLTAGGGRLLSQRLSYPLTHVQPIQERQAFFWHVLKQLMGCQRVRPHEWRKEPRSVLRKPSFFQFLPFFF